MLLGYLVNPLWFRSRLSYKAYFLQFFTTNTPLQKLPHPCSSQPVSPPRLSFLFMNSKMLTSSPEPQSSLPYRVVFSLPTCLRKQEWPPSPFPSCSSRPSPPSPSFPQYPFPHIVTFWGAQGAPQSSPRCYGFRRILWYAWQVKKFQWDRNLTNGRNEGKIWRVFPLLLSNW